MIFAQPLEPLTRRQRNAAMVIGTLAAATRLLAVSRSLWDWDEALFVLGVRGYDVAQHHPHPPGYPLFIAAAKLVHVIVADEFRALQVVVILAAMALFPALFALARELRFPFPVAAGAAALCTFFPNVWYYGGTALSDIPSLVLVLTAAALLLRGCRDPRAYVLGAVVLGAAAGVRPQNLLVGFAPAVIATFCRRKELRSILAALALGTLILAASYAGAALASSSWRDYLDASAAQSRYIHDVDSFHNPARPPLRELTRGIFVEPMHAGRFDFVLAALAAVGFLLAVRRPGALVALAMFVPIQLFTWLMLDMSNFSRYSVAFLPMYALFIAAAFVWMRTWAAIPYALIAAQLIVWTLPALNEVRRTDSPVVVAMNSVRSAGVVYVQGGVAPFASALLPQERLVFVEKETELPMTGAPFLCEGSTIAQDARVFRRSRQGHLATFVRKHFFEVAVVPAARAHVFGDGWYGQETDGELAWNWMKGRATMLLPPAGPRARLTLRFHVPASAPTLTVMMNGVSHTIRCTSPDMTAVWDFDVHANAPNELTLEIAPVFNPSREHAGGDARDLGLQLFAYDWRPE
jgi:hypothetical protein